MRFVSTLSVFLDRHGIAAFFAVTLLAFGFYGARALWKDACLPALNRHFVFIDEQTRALRDISWNQQQQVVLLREIHRHQTHGRTEGASGS